MKILWHRNPPIPPMRDSGELRHCPYADLAAIGVWLETLDGEWSLYTDCETAGALESLVKERGLDARQVVVGHPWISVGRICAIRRGLAPPR